MAKRSSKTKGKKLIAQTQNPVDQTPPIPGPIDLTNNQATPVGMQGPQGMPPGISPEAMAAMYASKQ